ncbi:ATP-dependent DNA helicase PIF1-like protein [Tanacetum coccineum]
MERQIKSESKSHSKKKTVKQSPAMTPNAKLTPIKDISPMVTNMRIRGRVISKWHAHKLNQAHDPYSLELVLQDEEGDRIQRAILTPTHELVDMINDRMLLLIHGDEKTYNSSDTVGVADVDTNFNETMYTE